MTVYDNPTNAEIANRDLATETFAPLDQILPMRKNTHGKWPLQARISREIKELLSENGANMLSEPQQESLDMIAVKISRILAGDADFEDHWRDIEGYARITADLLKPLDKPAVDSQD